MENLSPWLQAGVAAAIGTDPRTGEKLRGRVKASGAEQLAQTIPLIGPALFGNPSEVARDYDAEGNPVAVPATTGLGKLLTRALNPAAVTYGQFATPGPTGSLAEQALAVFGGIRRYKFKDPTQIRTAIAVRRARYFALQDEARKHWQDLMLAGRRVDPQSLGSRGRPDAPRDGRGRVPGVHPGCQVGSHPHAAGARYKPSTVRGHENRLRLYVMPRIGAVPLAALRRGDVRRVVDEVAVEKSASTALNVRDALRIALQRQVDLEVIDLNPAAEVRAPSPEHAPARFLTPQEADRQMPTSTPRSAPWPPWRSQRGCVSESYRPSRRGRTGSTSTGAWSACGAPATGPGISWRRRAGARERCPSGPRSSCGCAAATGSPRAGPMR